MSGMEAQRQPNGATGVAAQPMSAHALSHGLSEERLTNGVRCASVADMKTRATTSLIRRRTCYVRAGVHARGIVRDLLLLWRAGRFVEGEILIAVAAVAPRSQDHAMVSSFSCHLSGSLSSVLAVGNRYSTAIPAVLLSDGLL